MRSTASSRVQGRPATRLTLLVTVRDRHRHNSMAQKLLARARKAKVAGAIVFRGAEGFGRSGQLHNVRGLSDDRPLAVVFVDEPAKIDTLLESFGQLLEGVVVVLDAVEVLDL